MTVQKSYIGFDARPLFRKRDGIGTYTEQTILAAAKLYPKTMFIGVVFRGDLKRGCLTEALPQNINIITLPFSWRFYRALAEVGIWLKIDKYIPHSLSGFVYFNFVSLPWVSDYVKKHLVVYDGTFLEYPETVNKKNLRFLKKFVNKSINKPNTQLFTISQFSAAVLQNFLNKEFKVAYPGSSPLKILNRGTGNGAFLFVGTLEPRKNLINLVCAYNMLPDEKQRKHRLIIAGRDGWYYQELQNLIKNNANIIRIINPSDEQLAKLYAGTFCFVMPSIFEGFGIPVIDATRFNLPVITSAKSSMQEILGKDGAIFIDPTSTSSIKNGLKKIILMENKTINTMVTNANISIEKFTWERTAKKLFGDFT